MAVWTLAVGIAFALIQVQYDRWSSAYVRNDVDVLLDILAPDYELTAFSGSKISRPKYEASLRHRKEAGVVDSSTYMTKIQRIALTVNEATIVSFEVITTPDASTKITTVHTHVYDDRWVILEGAWRLKTTKTLEEKTKFIRPS